MLLKRNVSVVLKNVILKTNCKHFCECKLLNIIYKSCNTVPVNKKFFEGLPKHANWRH